ncbi:PQQ-binding-like beta-propeller repeat protein [Pontibacter sp. 172403-2]|uniref:outer membrane protein assembly factor BamB family protein n=1 Tax=Pontibacter rufus TaxID=2791028 RepID=UPI0018AF63A6|nr:PQQ-binding-like beta-propeller repeat protein [Pontibacter sp. 172403-2]MBF9252193.1 PQQ-binding-like beta-propeller repeat protein [Pontibacter sp. 172403-2]
MKTKIRLLITAGFMAFLSVPAYAQDKRAAATLKDSQKQMLYNQHATKTSSINSKNVNAMRLSWKYPTQHPVSHAPLVEGSAVYFGDWGGTIYKVDVNNGNLVWKKAIEEPKTEWPWHGFAGTGTLGGGKLFEASVEGNAFALDPATGEVLWKTKFTDDPEAGNLGTLLYYDGLVYIGVSSVEEMQENSTPDLQGKVVALNAEDGRKVWEKALVEPPQNGAPMWTSFALDPELNTLFFTTGNNYTGEEASAMSDAVIAVDAKTGDIKWFTQVTPHDLWTHSNKKGPDYDFAGGAQLFTANINGQPRKLVGAAQKSGIYYALDAETGEKVWEISIGYGGVDGGMHGEASIGEGTVLAWSNNNYNHGNMAPDKAKITIKALDASTGKLKWVKNEAQPAAIVPGYLAGDVYFVGSLDGTLQAYNADDGKQLWSTKNPSPVISWLWVKGNTLYLGGGAPDLFKWADKKAYGMYAYSVKQ